jgi:hypothetical protein
METCGLEDSLPPASYALLASPPISRRCHPGTSDGGNEPVVSSMKRRSRVQRESMLLPIWDLRRGRAAQYSKPVIGRWLASEFQSSEKANQTL